VLDNYLFLPARSAGRVTGGGIDGLIERRHFGSLLLTGVLNLDETARRAGYVQARLPPHPDWDVRLYVPMGTSNPCPD
jgi:hypothetical protein